MSEFIRVTVEHLVGGEVLSSRMHCLDADGDQDRIAHRSALDGRLVEVDLSIKVASQLI